MEFLEFILKLILSIAILGIILAIIWLFILIISAICFFIQGFSLYKMAKTADFPYPWFAFIPILNLYLLCVISKRKFTLFRGSLKLRHSSYSFWFLLIVIAIYIVAAYSVNTFFSASSPGVSIISSSIYIPFVIFLFCKYVWMRNLLATYKPQCNVIGIALCSTLIPVFSTIVILGCRQEIPAYGAYMYRQFKEYDPILNVYEPN